MSNVNDLQVAETLERQKRTIEGFRQKLETARVELGDLRGRVQKLNPVAAEFEEMRTAARKARRERFERRQRERRRI